MTVRIEPGQDIPQQLRRMTVSLADRAIAKLEEARKDHAHGIHEARKATKKLRAILRLARGGDDADADFARGENARFRDVARSVAAPREATALVETLDRFIADYPGEIARCHMDVIRARLEARRDRIVGDRARLDPAVQDALATCREGRSALADHDFSGVGSAALALRARKTLKDWRKTLKRARKRGHDEDFHELRKAVKAHEAHLAMLAGFWAGKAKKRHGRVDALGERLGEINDIAVMREGLRSGAFDLGTDVDLSPFVALLKRHRTMLKKKALKQARKLHKRRPRGLKKTFAAAHMASADLTRAA